MPRNSDLNAVARQWEMLQLLPKKMPGMTSSELQAKLDSRGHTVVKRTVERDLRDLSEAFPILCNDRGKPYGWYWNPDASANLPGITLAEALSLRLVEDLLKPLLPKAILSSLQAHFNQAQTKLRTLQADNAAANWQNKVRHVPPTLPLLPPTIDENVLETVQQALLYDQQVKVDYTTAHGEKRSWQTLHPLALVQRGPVTYLVATAFQYQDILLYAVHRMLDAMIVNRPANRPVAFNLDQYIASGALQFGVGTLQLKARVSDELADYLRETRLSQDQILQEDEEDYLLTATVSDSWQLRWWIKSMGAGIVVLEPVGLREEIFNNLKSSLKMYS